MLNIVQKNIIEFIFDKRNTTYDELSLFTRKSKRTIAKNIKIVNEVIYPTGAKIIPKQNKGVYIEGDINALLNYLKKAKIYIGNSEEERIIYIYSKFLFDNSYLKVQELADQLYVSRSTLESSLVEVRRKFKEQGFFIENSKKGMSLEINEEDRRNLMVRLINYYWSNKDNLIPHKNDINQLDVATHLDNILDIEVARKVLSILNNFLSNSNIYYTDYEYKSLAIQLIVILERIYTQNYLNNLNISNVQNPFLNSSSTLIQSIEKVFKISIPYIEREYINSHIWAIETKIENKQQEKNSHLKEDTKQILRDFFLNKLNYTETDCELFNGLSYHLDAAIKRFESGLEVSNPYTRKIKTSFSKAFSDAILLSSFINKKYNIKLDEDEIAFVSLHIGVVPAKLSPGAK